MSFDRDNIAKVILNNGAIGAYGFVGKDFAEGPNKKISELKMESQLKQIQKKQKALGNSEERAWN